MLPHPSLGLRPWQAAGPRPFPRHRPPRLPRPPPHGRSSSQVPPLPTAAPPPGRLRFRTASHIGSRRRLAPPHPPWQPGEIPAIPQLSLTLGSEALSPHPPRLTSPPPIPPYLAGGRAFATPPHCSCPPLSRSPPAPPAPPSVPPPPLALGSRLLPRSPLARSSWPLLSRGSRARLPRPPRPVSRPPAPRRPSHSPSLWLPAAPTLTSPGTRQLPFFPHTTSLPRAEADGGLAPGAGTRAGKSWGLCE